MNTNRLYIVDVYRVIESDALKNDKSVKVYSTGEFARKTVVYDNDYCGYDDLITGKNLSVGLTAYSSIGREYIYPKSFVPYNEYLNNQKENLSKRKIKKLYIEHKNNGNNK